MSYWTFVPLPPTHAIFSTRYFVNRTVTSSGTSMNVPCNGTVMVGRPQIRQSSMNLLSANKVYCCGWAGSSTANIGPQKVKRRKMRFFITLSESPAFNLTPALCHDFVIPGSKFYKCPL